MRMMVGLMGVLLPIILIAIDLDVRDSLSDYYYSSGDRDVFSARDVFVGTLFMTGAFLITYKAFERNLDNTLSILAGAMTLIVALVPSNSTRIHHIAAGLFIASLGVLCFFFAKQEGKRGREGVAPKKRLSPRPWRKVLVRHPMFWRDFHLVCSLLIAGSLAFLALQHCVLHWNNGVFWGEFVAVWAFGFSWLAKGSELDMLWPTRARQAFQGPPRPGTPAP